MRDKLISFLEFYGYDDVECLGKNGNGDILFEASFMSEKYTVKIVINDNAVKLYEYKHKSDQDHIRSGISFRLESEFTLEEMEEVV